MNGQQHKQPTHPVACIENIKVLKNDFQLFKHHLSNMFLGGKRISLLSNGNEK